MMPEPITLRCARHPKVETTLRCNRCGKPICPRCLVQTPVGARCKECAQLRRLPIFEVSPLHYVRAILTGGGLGIGLGILWALLGASVPFGYLLIPLGIGFAIGEGISLAVNRKRGRGLQIVAGLCVLASFVVSGAIRSWLFLDIYTLLGLAVALLLAVSRLR